MGIKANFNRQDLHKVLMQRMEKINDVIIMRLQALGEECVNLARSLPKDVGFEDQTGNLRSSIGYVLYLNGKSLSENFEQVLEGKDGVDAGKKLAKDIASNYPSGFALVVVAGMNYAAALEANGAWKIKSQKSYDVLTSAELYAIDKFPEILEKIKSGVKNMK